MYPDDKTFSFVARAMVIKSANRLLYTNVTHNLSFIENRYGRG